MYFSIIFTAHKAVKLQNGYILELKTKAILKETFRKKLCQFGLQNSYFTEQPSPSMLVKI